MGIINGLLKRSQTTTAANPSNWLVSLFGAGQSTAAGVSVNPNTALQYLAVFACVRILSEGVASLPLPVYEITGEDSRKRARMHPVYRVLHDQANPEMTAYTLRSTLMGHVLTWGNGYAEIEFGPDGHVRALWPLRPDRVIVERNQADKQLQYRVQLSTGEEAVLIKERVLHIPGLGFDGIKGYSPIQLAKEAIGLGLATEEFGSRFFSNGSHYGGFLKHPNKMSDEAFKRLKESINENAGLTKAHRYKILEEGLDLVQVGVPPEAAQFLETRKFQISEIARLYRVPPHMLADLERATFSNIEHQSMEYVIHTLRPWLVNWEQSINWKLFTPKERERLFAEHIVEGLLRGDTKSRYEAYAVARQNGWLSANDIRRLENMNPVDGGDIYLVPLNMVPADYASKPRQPDQDQSDRSKRFMERRKDTIINSRQTLAGSYRKVIADAVGRVLKREEADVIRQAKKLLGQRNTESFAVWLSEFYRDHEEYIMRQMQPVFSAYGEAVQAAAADEVGAASGMTPETESFLNSYLYAYVLRHNGASMNELSQVALDAEAAGEDQVQALQDTFDHWQDVRKDSIAHEESVRLGNAVALTTYALAGILKVRWAAVGETCPYCRSLDGKVVSTNTAFLEKDEEYQPDGADQPLRPSRSIKHPPAHQGCDCHIIAEVG